MIDVEEKNLTHMTNYKGRSTSSYERKKILLQSTAVGPFLLGIIMAEFILETNYPSEMDKSSRHKSIV